MDNENISIKLNIKSDNMFIFNNSQKNIHFWGCLLVTSVEIGILDPIFHPIAKLSFMKQGRSHKFFKGGVWPLKMDSLIPRMDSKKFPFKF